MAALAPPRPLTWVQRGGTCKPQDDAHCLEHQRIASRPPFDFAAIGFPDATQKTEPELP